MTYTLDGINGSKAIVRQVFGSTVGLGTNPASTTTPSGNPGNPGTPSQPTGNCASTVNLTAGNRYDYRTTPTAAAASDSRQQVIGSGTFGGKSVLVVEIRNLVGGQPDANGNSRIYYEDTGNESVTVPAGTFGTCTFQLDNITTTTNFLLAGIAFGGYNFMCSGTGTANAAAIGGVRNAIDSAACSGSIAGGASPPPIRSTTELVRATVNGSSYPHKTRVVRETLGRLRAASFLTTADSKST